MNKCRKEHSLQIKLLVKRLCHLHNLIITFRCRTNNHLGALSRRYKARCMAVKSQFLSIFFHAVLHQTHRRQNLLPRLMGSKNLQTLRCRKFQIHTHPVRQKPHPTNQFRICARNRLYMNIPLKSTFCSQLIKRRIDQFHRIIRTL